MQNLMHGAPLLLLVYVVMAFAPGLVAGASAGLRGWLLAAAAPLLSYGLIGAAASALPLVGIAWSPLSLALVTAVFVTGAVVVRYTPRLLHRAAPPPAVRPTLERWSIVHHGGTVVAILVSGAVGVVMTAAATRGFSAVPQIWDAVFHANATHFIAVTGQSDPAALQALNNPNTDRFFYPNAYHLLAAAVIMTTGSSVPTVLEAGTALAPGLLALTVAALVRYCGGRPALAVSAAMLSCAFTAFPYDLLPWGSLLPFNMALTLLPAFLAIWVAMLRAGGESQPIALPIMLGLAGIGLLALHPSVAVAAAVLSLCFLAQLWISRRPRIGDLGAIGLAGASALALGAPLLIASAGVASGPAYDWPTTLLPADALGQVLFQSHGQPFPQWWLVVLTAIGLFQLRRFRPILWLVAGGLFFAGLFVLAASYEGEIVTLLTRPWWNDKWRLAALWTVCSIPLAAAGLVAIRDQLWAVLRRAAPFLESRLRVVPAGLLALVLLAMSFLSDGLYLNRNETRLAQAFSDGPTVSTAKRSAFDELARMVPEGSIVMNDPYDGSAWMWALTGVRPVFASPVIAGHELPTMDPNRRILFEAFNQLDSNIAVQSAVEQLNIRYVIICEGFIAPADGHVQGMLDLDAVHALEPVFRNADARIYRIRDDFRPATGT